MLYIFAGFPGKGLPPGSRVLNAGGLQCAVEERMGIALLEHGKLHYRKEGVFSGDDEKAEWLYPVEYRLSDLCLRDGITWDWFNKNWGFGNGVTVHKTIANYEMKTVVHGTEDTLDEYLRGAGPTRLSDLALEQKHIRTEGWEKYERRWLPGTCPQESHIVHLTWLVTKHRLPPCAYDTIRWLIEVPGMEVNWLADGLLEPRHCSEVRRWDGAPAAGVAR